MFSCNSQLNTESITKLVSELGSLLFTHEIVIDSRQVTQNSIFCAYPGSAVDGRKFIPDAIAKGAGVILYEDDNACAVESLDQNNKPVISAHAGICSNTACQMIPVKNLMQVVGILAAHKYNNPSARLKMIGVTGTNGKTSIAYWLNQAYTFLQKKTGIIGTLGVGVFPEITYNAMTTPDPVSLQRVLTEFVAEQVSVVAMEVSSHSLDQGRVNGINFNTVIFTNLTQDHLDYHKTMENYYLAKRNLFYWQGLKHAVINVDDEYGKRLYAELLNSFKSFPELKIISYGIIHGDLRAHDVKITLSGTEFNLSDKSQYVSVKTQIIGKFNVYNVLAVAAVMLLDGYSLNEIAKILPQLTPVRGRMDAIIVPNKPLVIVDFAHTPDSLENALVTLQDVEHSGKIYCAFGCGGNRDATKRPIMGQIAVKYADHVIVTSDNPRFENPDDIIDQIVVGLDVAKYQRIANRTDAIKTALKLATANDIVLIAGKGHEEYQEINGIKEPFSDFTIAQEALKLCS